MGKDKSMKTFIAIGPALGCFLIAFCELAKGNPSWGWVLVGGMLLVGMVLIRFGNFE